MSKLTPDGPTPTLDPLNPQLGEVLKHPLSELNLNNPEIIAEITQINLAIGIAMGEDGKDVEGAKQYITTLREKGVSAEILDALEAIDRYLALYEDLGGDHNLSLWLRFYMNHCDDPYALAVYNAIAPRHRAERGDERIYENKASYGVQVLKENGIPVEEACKMMGDFFGDLGLGGIWKDDIWPALPVLLNRAIKIEGIRDPVSLGSILSRMVSDDTTYNTYMDFAERAPLDKRETP